jgi:hypothetical protein
LLKVDSFDYKFNPKLQNITVGIDNSNPELTAINFTIIPISMKPLTNLIQIVTLTMPEDEQDKLYRKVLFRTTINVCRLGQIQSNFLVKAFMESTAKSVVSGFR